MTGRVRGSAAGERMVADLLSMHRPLRADVAMLDKALDLLADAVTDPIADMVNGMTIADFTWQPPSTTWSRTSGCSPPSAADSPTCCRTWRG